MAPIPHTPLVCIWACGPFDGQDFHDTCLVLWVFLASPGEREGALSLPLAQDRLWTLPHVLPTARGLGPTQALWTLMGKKPSVLAVPVCPHFSLLPHRMLQGIRHSSSSSHSQNC